MKHQEQFLLMERGDIDEKREVLEYLFPDFNFYTIKNPAWSRSNQGGEYIECYGIKLEVKLQKGGLYKASNIRANIFSKTQLSIIQAMLSLELAYLDIRVDEKGVYTIKVTDLRVFASSENHSGLVDIAVTYNSSGKVTNPRTFIEGEVWHDGETLISVADKIAEWESVKEDLEIAMVLIDLALKLEKNNEQR